MQFSCSLTHRETHSLPYNTHWHTHTLRDPCSCKPPLSVWLPWRYWAIYSSTPLSGIMASSEGQRWDNGLGEKIQKLDVRRNVLDTHTLTFHDLCNDKAALAFSIQGQLKTKVSLCWVTLVIVSLLPCHIWLMDEQQMWVERVTNKTDVVSPLLVITVILKMLKMVNKSVLWCDNGRGLVRFRNINYLGLRKDNGLGSNKYLPMHHTDLMFTSKISIWKK